MCIGLSNYVALLRTYFSSLFRFQLFHPFKTSFAATVPEF